MADGLLTRRLGIDRGERERYLDELRSIGRQQGSPAATSRCAMSSGTLVWAKCSATSLNGSMRYFTAGSPSGSLGTETMARRQRSGLDLAFWTCWALTLISRVWGRWPLTSMK